MLQLTHLSYIKYYGVDLSVEEIVQFSRLFCEEIRVRVRVSLESTPIKIRILIGVDSRLGLGLGVILLLSLFSSDH